MTVQNAINARLVTTDIPDAGLAPVTRPGVNRTTVTKLCAVATNSDSANAGYVLIVFFTWSAYGTRCKLYLYVYD